MQRALDTSYLVKLFIFMRDSSNLPLEVDNFSLSFSLNDFLSRHVDMAIKSFLLESCPHQPQEKKRPEGLYFFSLNVT